MKGQILSRREFIGRSGLFLGCLCTSGVIIPSTLEDLFSFFGNSIENKYLQELYKTAPEAQYWIPVNSSQARCTSCHNPAQIKGLTKFNHDSRPVKCLLCAQGCVIKENERGKCRARMNIDGKLKSLVYGRPVSIHTDPIEKKPFYHFLPGHQAFSMATSGCPLSCQFCQNWQISQSKPEDFPSSYIPANSIVTSAKSQNAPIIAFTYNEPTVFFEYLMDIAKEAKERGIRTALVSCGFMSYGPLREMCNVLDAIKIDLKGYSEEFYQKVCSAELRPVLNSIKQISKTKVHLELVNLVVPTLNDSDKMLYGLVDWIYGELGPDVPIHFTRFHPDYKLQNLSPTPVATIERARNIAISKGIHYAYVGNIPDHEGNSTYCPSCKKAIVIRNGMFTLENHIEQGKCRYCRQAIAGVWQ
ncbi:MAG: AmmeMemoRadiSam system radical SAM enzyme [Bacteroidota bacterium]|nr:AmmeMemoRadiSam system radical SAM enzyme [Bacteroidota bacterium]MDP4195574.1 AmmeMemoRadiSam system radical SAM enzyme [Bacteroidota bacterium]